MSNEESIFLESGLLEQYALNLCSPVEMMEVEQMIKSSSVVREHYNDLQDNLEKLAEIRAVRPPEEVREKVLDFLNQEEETPIVPMTPDPEEDEKTRAGGSFMRIAAGLAFLLALGLLYQQWNTNQTLLAKNNILEDEVEALKKDLGGIEGQLASMNERMAFLNDPATNKLRLEKAEENDLKLVAYWNEEEERSLLDLRNVPTPPKGKCYQLWADVHGEMVSVAVIPDSEDEFVIAQFYAEAESLNITLEDAPGSDHATVSALVTSVSI